MESDLHRTGHENCRANDGGGRASERCEASDVKNEEMEDTAPPHRTSPPRVIDTESAQGRGVSNDGSLQQTEGSQERGAGVQQRGQQQLSSREEAPTSERGMPETLMVGEAQTKKASSARGQAVRREVFQVGVRGQQHTQAQTKCVACGLWGARLSVDAERSSSTCNTRCMRRWQLDQLAAFRRQEPMHDRVCGCGDKGPEEEGDPPSARTRMHCNSGLTSFGSPLQHACAGCGAEEPTHPCAQCWEVWYCTDDCARVHWQQHQTQCQQGAWCGGCGNEGQSVWCEVCIPHTYAALG